MIYKITNKIRGKINNSYIDRVEWLDKIIFKEYTVQAKGILQIETERNCVFKARFDCMASTPQRRPSRKLEQLT